MSVRGQLAALAAAAVGLALVPAVAGSYWLRYGILIFQYAGLALSWNIISGYAGYVSFGHVAFFGLGGYTGALLMEKLGTPWPLAVLAGGLTSVIFAWPLGRILLRLKGPYFAIAMLGLAQVLRVIASAWQSFTGGGQGVSLPPERNLHLVWWGMLAVAAAALVFTLWLDRGRFGLRLVAIREDEAAAEVMGVDTVKDKVRAFVISAAAPGLIGALYVWSIGYIDPISAFRGHITLNMISMTMLGGIGTVWGPVLGAAVLSVISEELWARFPELYLSVFGGVVALSVIFLPQGIVPWLRQRLRRWPGGRGAPDDGAGEAVTGDA